MLYPLNVMAVPSGKGSGSRAGVFDGKMNGLEPSLRFCLDRYRRKNERRRGTGTNEGNG